MGGPGRVAGADGRRLRGRRPSACWSPGTSSARAPDLTFWLLALALALAGLGFGVTVVPLTSAVLSHVPARHSGMAASATNTARQLGAVVGVAVLGAIVNAHLTAAWTTSSHQLPGASAEEHRAEDPRDRRARRLVRPQQPAGVGEVHLFPAFLDGLKLSLVVALVLIVLAGLVAAAVREPAPEDDLERAVS